MNTIWLETKYVSLLSSRFRNFKKRGMYQWNFSCPICGDSKKNPRKARGYIFNDKGKLRYYCHNCNKPMLFRDFLKSVDLSLYNDYTKERLMAFNQEKALVDQAHDEFVKKLEKPKFIAETPLNSLKKISQLKEDHPAKLYVEKRLIPPNYHHKLFLTLKFKEFVNSVIPGKFESVEIDEPRLIIPFLDEDRKLFGFQGRSFKKTGLRYITIMLEDRPKLFGLDTVKAHKHIYAFEGPIDSMFIPNSVASAGGTIDTDLEAISKDRNLFTIVYDNEPRNKQIVKKISKSISLGYPVCIWPESVKEKDINSMVMSGYTTDEILDIIEENTFTGLQAELRLSLWRKI